MADNNILIELEEDARRDAIAKFFKKHGTRVYAAIGILIMAVGAHQLWSFYETNQRIKAGDKFYAVIDDYTAPETTKRLDDAAQNSSLKEIAPLAQASLLINSKKPDEAIKLYGQVANNPKSEPALKELAKLNYLNLKLQKNPADKAALEDLKKLSESAVAFKHTALEILAAIYLKNNELDKAKAIFKQLAEDKTTPPSMAGRAKALNGSI